VQIVKDTFVPMRDGVSLAVDLFQPDELALHAGVLLVTPYQKDAVFEMPLGSDGRPLAALPMPPLPPGINPMLLSVTPLVEAGFVVAVADARGTGFSEGVYDYYNLDGGPFDGFDLVEWLAGQPWCTGRIGMMGSSAAAISCYIAALTHPPHLEAMAPNMHPGDFYFDQWRPGGVFRYENRISWSVGMHARTSPIDPGDPAAPSWERKRAVYEDRFHQFGRRIAEGKNAANLDWLTEMYDHSSYDDFWKERSFIRRAAEIDIPTLHGGVWYDHFGRGTLTSHQAINVPKRLFMGPGSLFTRPDLGDGGFTRLLIRWFDHFLRDANNGVLDSPEARIYMMGIEDYVDEPAWPIEVEEVDLYLCTERGGGASSANDRVLAHQPGADEGADVLVHDPAHPVRTPPDPFDQGVFESASLTYTTEALAADVEVVGTSRLVLHAVCDAIDVDLCVRLADVDQSGRSRLLNTGALKATHAPSHEAPTALAPGQPNRLEVEIWPIANVFKAGHRIRIAVSASDFPFFECNPLPSTTRILFGGRYPSRLVIPMPRRSRP
jgi:uncharacterized protein